MDNMANPGKSLWERIVLGLRKDPKQAFLIFFLLVLVAVMSLLAPGRFLSVRNFKNMGFQMAEFGILAIGMSVVIMTGGINLSLLGSAMLSAIVGASLMRSLNQAGGWGTLPSFSSGSHQCWLSPFCAD